MSQATPLNFICFPLSSTRLQRGSISCRAMQEQTSHTDRRLSCRGGNRSTKPTSHSLQPRSKLTELLQEREERKTASQISVLVGRYGLVRLSARPFVFLLLTLLRHLANLLPTCPLLLPPSSIDPPSPPQKVPTRLADTRCEMQLRTLRHERMHRHTHTQPAVLIMARNQRRCYWKKKEKGGR